MLADLHIALLQTHLSWENKAENLAQLEKLILQCNAGVDLIILPEMFSTGFTMNAIEMSELTEGVTLEWMKKMAVNSNACITGSFIAKQEDAYYNRLVWMRPDGSFDTYDKRHLFRMAEEDHHYSGGQKILTVTLNGWKIRPLICYDLRFPVWSRNRYLKEGKTLNAAYDVLIYVANWPAARVTAWDVLLRARAIENQAYCLGVNRIGMDGKNIEYVGHTAAINAKGEYVKTPIENQSGVFEVTLNYRELEEFREKFPQGLDADDFNIEH